MGDLLFRGVFTHALFPLLPCSVEFSLAVGSSARPAGLCRSRDGGNAVRQQSHGALLLHQQYKRDRDDNWWRLIHRPCRLSDGQCHLFNRCKCFRQCTYPTSFSLREPERSSDRHHHVDCRPRWHRLGLRRWYRTDRNFMCFEPSTDWSCCAQAIKRIRSRLASYLWHLAFWQFTHNERNNFWLSNLRWLRS